MRRLRRMIAAIIAVITLYVLRRIQGRYGGMIGELLAVCSCGKMMLLSLRC